MSPRIRSWLQGGFKVRTSPKSGLQGLLEIAQAVL